MPQQMKQSSRTMSGSQISVKTLNLNQDFLEIAAQLNATAAMHFESRGYFNDYSGTKGCNSHKPHETKPQNRSVKEPYFKQFSDIKKPTAIPSKLRWTYVKWLHYGYFSKSIFDDRISRPTPPHA